MTLIKETKGKAKVKSMLMNECTKARLGYLGTVEGRDMYEKTCENPDIIINLFENCKADENKYFNMNREFFKVNRGAKSYYIFNRTDGADVFIDLPLVKDTEIFRWTYKECGHEKSIKMLWTQLTKGSLRFNCAYYLKHKSASISVMYGNAILHNLRINNAENEDILNEINRYITDFKRAINHSVDADEMKNTNRFA